MADTLINVNQNQLNTQNGSFTELIKSTQQGKEKLATALVNQGQNVSSSSTLSDMATAVNNIKNIDSFNMIKGNIGDITLNNSLYHGYGTVVQNEYGIFYLYLTSATNLRVANVTSSLYDNLTSLMYTDFTINPVVGFAVTNFKLPAYVSPDGTKIVYCTTDIQTIYEYTIDYSKVTTGDPALISCTLTKTYTLASALGGDVTVFIYDEDNKRIGLCVGSHSNNVNRPFYFAEYTDETITGLSVTQYTKEGLGTSYCTSPIVVNNNTVIIAAYINNITTWLLCTIDYTNHKITAINAINFNSNRTFHSHNSIGQGTFIQIGNRKALAFSLINTNNPYYRIYESILVLVFTDDNSIYTFNQKSYNYDIFVNVSYYDFYNVIPTYSTNKVFLSSGFPGTLWEITIDNNNFSVKCLDSLFNAGSNVAYLYYLAPLSFYNIANNKVFYFSNAGSINSFNLLKEQIFGYKTDFGNGEIVFISNNDWSTITSGALNAPTVDVLEEAI